MAEFDTEGLQALGPLYRVQGGQVPTRRVDLESSISLVHDVSRLVDMSRSTSAFGGFTNFSFVNGHTVPGETNSSTQATIASSAFWATLGLNPLSSWLWLLEASARVPTGLTMTEAVFAIQQAAYTGAFTTHSRLMWRSTTVTAIAVNTSLLGAIPSIDLPAQRPILVPPDSVLFFGSTASGAAANIVGQLQCWAGPRFVLPPGLA